MSSAKRENRNIVLSCNNVILDIEGTTTSITFVKDVLFPYVRKHLETYVQEHWESEGFQAIVSALRTQAKEDKENKVDGVIDIPEEGEKSELAKAVIKNVLWQMDIDRKAKSLKDLQGLIMESGYKKGELKGHLYEDFEPNLKLWTELGKNVYIYSSGSVHAQKLLYGYSEKGDLLPYIKGHFDTTVGMKGNVESYKKIVEQISASPSETVFFTDVPIEAKAAKEAGLLAILLSREGNAPLSDADKEEFQVIKSFSEINFDNIPKKRKVCDESIGTSDNKSVELCEVSLNPPLKEPTNSTLIQQSEVNMEVDDSSTKEVSTLDKTNTNAEEIDSKLNGQSENDDVEMKTIEGNDNKRDDIFEAQTNNDKLQKAIEPEKVDAESEGLSGLNNENGGKDCEKTETTSAINRNESEKLVESTNDVQPSEENPCKKADQDIKEPNHDSITENGEIIKDKTDSVNSSTENQHEGNLETIINNMEIVLDKSIEENKDLNTDNNKVTIDSKLDLSDIADPQTNENCQIDNKELEVSSDGDQTSESKETDPSENATDLHAKCAHNGSKTSEGNVSNEGSTEGDAPNMGVDSDNTNFETETKSDIVSKNTLSDENNSESIKEIEITDTASKTDNDFKTIIEETPVIGENSTSLTLGENASVGSNLDKAAPEKVEEEKIEMSKEVCKVGDESINGSCSDSKKESHQNHLISEPTPNGDVEKQAVSAIVTENHNQLGIVIDSSHERNTAESCNDKEEIPKLSPTTNRKISDNPEEAAAVNIKDNIIAELSRLEENEGTTMSVNGKDSNSESVESIDDEKQKNEIDGTMVSEVKKCEVPENSVMTAVVEA